MKNTAVVFIILLCTATFFTGCEELPNENCWPDELSKSVPWGVTVALEIALSPNGFINVLINDGFDDDGVICDEVQNITYGPAYQTVFFNEEIQSASLEDIFIFQDRYVSQLYCHEQAMTSRVEVYEAFGVWHLGSIGGGSIGGLKGSLATLEDYLGSDFTDCTRGLIRDFKISCAIVTDKQGITRFYPLNPDEPIWGNTEGKGIGEFSLTKEEFSEWYYDVYANYEG